jgi:hypothetical protein
MIGFGVVWKSVSFPFRNSVLATYCDKMNEIHFVIKWIMNYNILKRIRSIEYLIFKTEQTFMYLCIYACTYVHIYIYIYNFGVFVAGSRKEISCLT